MDKLEERISRLPAAVYVLAAAAAVIVVGLLSVFLMSGGSGPEGPGDGQAMQSGDMLFPDYVLAAPAKTQVAYQFALDRPDVLMWMPCYCGCGGHNGHKSNKNCFIKEGSTLADPQFDEHGSTCEMCVNIALDARTMTAEGRPLSEIRSYIDATYGSIGPGTDTPLPPG